MPRGPRLDEPLAVHHVWNRGVDRCDIFRDAADREEFLTRIGAFVRAGHLAVYAWALMSNHFHLLTRTGNLGLSATMRILQGDYASYFNRRHRRCGHLFQNRFKSALVGEDAYCLTLLAYVHLNPVRAGMVTGLDALDTYPWTGHATLLGRQCVSWQDTDFVLREFGADLGEARAGYRRFVAGVTALPEPSVDGAGLRRGKSLWEYIDPVRRGREAWSFDERTYGSGDFVQSVLAQLNGEQTLSHPRLDAAAFVMRVVDQLAQRTGLQAAELRSNSKRPQVVRARRALCYLAVCRAAIPARQVALQLGVQPYTVLRCAAGGEQALAQLGCSATDLLAIP